MMAATGYIFVVVLVNLCFSTSSLIVGASSSNKESKKIPSDKALIHEGYPLEENIEQQISIDANSTYFKLDKPKQDLDEKFSFMERKLSRLENVMRNIDEEIKNKLIKLEHRLKKKLSDYIDDKLDAMNAKTETQNQNISRELNKISDKQNDFNKNIDQIQIIMRDIENRTVDYGLTLDILRNISVYFEQKLDSLKIDSVKVSIDSGIRINDTFSYALNLLDILANNISQNSGKFTNNTFNIKPKLNGLLNTTTDCCEIINFENKTYSIESRQDNVTMDPKNVTSTNSPFHLLLKNTTSYTEFREIIWMECKKEVVNNTDNDSSPLLHPLVSEALRHISLRTTDDGRIEHLHMRLGLEASWRGEIILSPARYLFDTMSYFMMAIYRNEVYLGIVTEHRWNELACVNTTTAMSAKQPAALLLTVTNDTLQLRHERTSAPFLEYHHELFGDINYFGFISRLNDGYQATYYYDC